MRISNLQYSQALYAALEGKKGKERTKAIHCFVDIVRRHKASARIDRILENVEKISLRADGLVKVEVQSAASLTQEIRDEIGAALKRKVFLDESVNPDLRAGMKLIVDNEILIDATARRQIDALFIKQ